MKKAVAAILAGAVLALGQALPAQASTGTRHCGVTGPWVLVDVAKNSKVKAKLWMLGGEEGGPTITFCGKAVRRIAKIGHGPITVTMQSEGWNQDPWVSATHRDKATSLFEVSSYDTFGVGARAHVSDRNWPWYNIAVWNAR